MGYVPIEGELVRVRLWDDMKNEFGTDYEGDIACRICFSCRTVVPCRPIQNRWINS